MAEQWLHNWLYSVVPISEQYTVWGYNSDGTSSNRIEFPLYAYLVGYCRGCGKAFSQKVPTSAEVGAYRETLLNIPQFGCVGPESLRSSNAN